MTAQVSQRQAAQQRQHLAHRLAAQAEQVAEVAAGPAGELGLVDEGPVAHGDQAVRGGRYPLVMSDDDQREP